MGLSETGKEYISKLTKDSKILVESINEILQLNQLENNEFIVDFARNFHGVTFDFYGQFDVELKLFWGLGNPIKPKDADVFKTIENQIAFFNLNNPDDDKPFTIEIDEQGRYYEDGCQASSSYIKKIEDLGFHWYQRANSKSITVLNEDEEKLLFQSKFENHERIKLADYSDEFVSWYKVNDVYIRDNGIELTIFE